MTRYLIGLISLICRLKYRRLGIVGLGNSKFVGFPVVTIRKGSKCIIGPRFVAVSCSSFQVIGVNHPVTIRTVSSDAVLHIGADCGFSGASIVAAYSIKIGNGCLLGSNVIIVDTDFHPIHSGERRHSPIPNSLASHEVIIGNNVFIGANSLILKGASIGDNSVVGAGSVVTGVVAANTIVAGNPAAVVGVVRA